MLIIQETHSCVEIENLWQNEWGGKIIFSHGTTNARGVAICCTNEVFKNVQNVFVDTEGRMIIVDF